MPYESAGERAIAPDIGLSPLSYRQANALIGSLIPLLAVGIAYQISQPLSTSRRWLFALLGGLFVAVDGLFVTESRYALLNVHTVFLGLLGHWLWLWGVLLPKKHSRKQILQQLFAGIALGSAIAVKWNGLGFLLSLVLWEVWRTVRTRQTIKPISIIQTLAFLVLVPTLAYCLLWWPHLRLTQENLFLLHSRLFTFHQQIGTGGHSACSKWFTWPLLIKPITYWYETIGPKSYTVSNLGNPPLWFLANSAICLLFAHALARLKTWLTDGTSTNLYTGKPKPGEMVGAYLLICYVANWLPWIGISRCTFNYLYMPAAVYSFVALAWLLSGWLSKNSRLTKIAAWIVIGLIAIAFLFWLPLALGLPLSPHSLQMRWWLKSWI